MTSKKSDSQPYQVLARRFRPQTFEQVVGQEGVLKTLRSAFASKRIPHAFLFSGSRGVGKTTTARILARCLNCERGPTADPCGECAACTGILDGSNADVVEIDAASHNLVDDIRELRDRVGFASMGSRYKVYILDEVHMLTRSAFNAFLKTLEEPPPNVVFIMATTELHKVPDTIRSRCQVHLFRQVEETDIARRLRAICDLEGVAMPDDVLAEIAATSRGGMRDAETALERILPVAQEAAGAFDLAAYRQLVHRVGTDAVLEVVTGLVDGDPAPALRLAAEAVHGGVDEREVLGEVLDVLRGLLLLGVDGTDSGLVPHTGRARERLIELVGRSEPARLEAMIQAGLLGRDRIRRLEDRRLVLELTLLRMARAGTLPELGELLEAVRSGAAGSGASTPVAPAGSRPASGGAAVATGGSDDLRGRLIGRLRQVKPLLVRTIEHSAVRGPDAGGAVTVALQDDRKMHRDRLQSRAVQDTLKELLQDLLGTPVELVVETPGGGAPAPAEPESTAGAEPGPGVRKVVEKFDGQILDQGRADPETR